MRSLLNREKFSKFHQTLSRSKGFTLLYQKLRRTDSGKLEFITHLPSTKSSTTYHIPSTTYQKGFTLLRQRLSTSLSILRSKTAKDEKLRRIKVVSPLRLRSGISSAPARPAWPSCQKDRGLGQTGGVNRPQMGK